MKNICNALLISLLFVVIFMSFDNEQKYTADLNITKSLVTGSKMSGTRKLRCCHSSSYFVCSVGL